MPTRATGRLVAWRLLAAALLYGALTGGGRSAHAAAFDRSNPRPGQVLISAPARIEIYTVADLAPAEANAIDVRTADLREVDLRDVTVDPVNPRRLSVGLVPSLGAGRYVVSFVDQTVDGSLDRGQFSFYVVTPPTTDERRADSHLSVGGPATAQNAAPAGNAQPVVALAIAVALAGTISAGTAIALRRRRIG